MRARPLTLALAAVAAAALTGCPDDDCDGWAQLAELDRAALSVQGTSADDVWVVGGGLGFRGPLAAHWDGARWTRLDLDAPSGGDALWWVWTAGDGTVWMVGEHGLVVRQHGTDVMFDRIATDATLYGVWGSGPDDVWIVGGQPGGGPEAEDDFVRHWDGAAFAPVAGVPVRGATLFKVWGSGAGDVWISGEGGTMLHATASGVDDHSSELSTAAPALTVHGCSASEVYAVAGQNLYAWDGARWARQAEPQLGSVANGVSCGAAGVLVVGNAGLKLRWDRTQDAWTDERAAAPSGVDLHGAWIDEAGRAWAVGRQLQRADAHVTPRRRRVAWLSATRRPLDSRDS